MKRGAHWLRRHLRIGWVATVLGIFLFCGVAGADNVVTATLNTTPSPTANPGDVLKFQANIFHNPGFNETPGTMMRVWVTTHDFSWVSDKLNIQYPGMGSVTVNFANGFTIPPDAKGGQTFDFYLVYGIWYPISEKSSVKVKPYLRKDIMLEQQRKFYRKIPPVQ